MSLMQRFTVRVALAVGARTLDTPCPEPEDIVAWQENALQGDQAEHVRQHVLYCADCYALWSGLVALDAQPEASPARRRARARWWVALPALALGVVAATVVPTLLDRSGPAGDPVAYQLSVQGGLVMRGATDEPLNLADGSALEIVLTPESATDRPFIVGLFALGSREVTRLDVPVELSPKGVAVIDVIVAEEVSVPADTRALIVVTTNTDSLPEPDALFDVPASAAPFQGDGWQAWRLDVARPGPMSPE